MKLLTVFLFLITNSMCVSANATHFTAANTSSIIPKKKYYSRSAYTKVGNLVSNSDFSGGMNGFEAKNLNGIDGKPLYSITTYNDKNWLQIDNATPAASNGQGQVSALINIPPALRNSVIEISFLVSGYFTRVGINNEDQGYVNVQIDPNKPESLHYYFEPKGATQFTLKLFRAFSNALLPSTSVSYTNILVKEAKFKYGAVKSLPPAGSAIQLARWMGKNWDEAKQEKIIAAYKNLGGMNRVWLGADLFATYRIKPALKRKNFTDTQLTPVYNNLQNERVPVSLDPEKIKYLDWFFAKCKQYGLKVHICLGAPFSNEKADYSPQLTIPGSYEFIDSDQEMRDGFTKLYASIVDRYKAYNNIVGWELLNEGFTTFSYSYAGINPGVPNHLRSYLFPGYRLFERQAYAAIKTIDKVHPVIFNGGNLAATAANHFDADDVCDWVCPSLYTGGFSVNAASISDQKNLIPTQGYGQILASEKNGNSLIIAKKFGGKIPTPLINGQRYYIVNLTATSFQLSATANGPALIIPQNNGEFDLYADDESGVDFANYVIQQQSFDPKFVYFSEFGGGVAGQNFLYRDEKINTIYINAIAKKLKKYGIPTLITFDEENLMFETKTMQLKKTGRQLLLLKQNP